MAWADQAETQWRRAWPVPDLAVMLGAGEGRLFVWLPVLLGLGIAAYFALRLEPEPAHYAAVLAGAGALWLAARRAGQAARLLALGAALLALGFALAGLRSHLIAAPVLSFRYYGPVEGRVVEIDRSARDRIRLTLDQVQLRDFAPDRVPGKVRVALTGADLPSGVVAGARVMTTGHLGPASGPSSPHSYDFRRHAWFEGLGAIGYTRNPVLLVGPAGGGLPMAGHRLRMRVSRAMQAQIGGQPGAVAAALMTGDRSGIAEATNEIMRASNLYHIISISGLHMGMLAGFVLGALRLGLAASGLALRLPAHKIAAVGALVAATLYLWLAGSNVATTRAYIMVAVMLGAVLADRRAISLRSLAIAALIILAIWPETVAQPGFQMSFAATAALILSWRPWNAIKARVPRLLLPVALLIVSSAIAGTATAPIAAAHFNRMADYGVLANLLAVPVMGALVMPAGVIAGLLAPFGLAAPALWVMGLGTRWMLWVAEWIASLDGAWHAVAAPGPLVLPLLILAAIWTVLIVGRLRWLGLVGLGAGFALWALTPRPALLIAPEGELVGIMTPAGRVLSRGRGGSYVAETWLLEDGDSTTQEQAAARPGFTGPRHAREASVAGRPLVHLTGKRSAGLAQSVCRPGALVITDQALNPPKTGWPCEMFDLTRLRRTGAVALIDTARGWQSLTVTDVVGQRLWAPALKARNR